MVTTPKPSLTVETRLGSKSKRNDKSYVPDWTKKLHKVVEKKEGNHTLVEDDRPADPKTMYRLRDPTKDLPTYKERDTRPCLSVSGRSIV